MERTNSLEEGSKFSSQDSSIKNSRGSIHSNKSIERIIGSISSTGSLKYEKQKDGAKVIIKAKPDKLDSDQKLSEASLKVSHKFITNWKQACDRTKDKTRDLLKRWRTLPEDEGERDPSISHINDLEKTDSGSCGWSVHVWTTWVDRFSVDTSETWEHEESNPLTPVQCSKFSHFFTYLLDHDQDDLVSDQDFEALSERLRHFADWSTNSAEFNILREVERGFMETFLHGIVDEKIGYQVNNQTYLTREGWLFKWGQLISGSKNLNDFPLWLQYFVKVMFQVINRSASGLISRDELSAFYSSVLGFDAVRVGEVLDLAYQAMTSNGDHSLSYHAYRLCFSNYLLARHPNGPGQFILGIAPTQMPTALFPVDYSALNAQPEDLEQYTPDHKSNRRSVVV